MPEGFVSEYSHSPIDFHDPSQVAGTPLFDDDRFIIKFNNFWTIEAPPGYSLLFTHPVNRTDLPFTTLTGLVDCDTFHDSPLNFPARWHDPNFNGVLPKGTPVAQCLPVKRESWAGRFEALSGDDTTRLIATQNGAEARDRRLSPAIPRAEALAFRPAQELLRRARLEPKPAAARLHQRGERAAVASRIAARGGAEALVAGIALAESPEDNARD